MALAEISVVPVGTGSPSVSKEVARAVEVLLKDERVKYELTSMGTIIEGDLDDILRVVTGMHRAVLEGGAMRVITTVKIDERLDKPLSMSGKLDSLKRALGC